jgi:hypothetical protein
VRNETSDRAHQLGSGDHPPAAVIDEPFQYRLVVGDQSAPVEQVFSNEHEEGQVCGNEHGRYEQHSP